MTSACMHVLDIFNNYESLSVPVFQRSYSWDTPEVVTLLRDLIAYGNDESSKSMFIGTMILSSTGTYGGKVQSIIDGQQRLVTMTLLSLVLASIERYGEPDYQKLIPPIVYKVKLKVHNKDSKQLEKLLNYNYKFEYVEFDDGNLIKNFQTIKRYVGNLSAEDLNALVKGMFKSIVSVIQLDPEDDIQGVLSSLNSTGKQLNDFDLIKNASLAQYDIDTQEELYNSSWRLICEDSERSGTSEQDLIKRIMSNYNLASPYSNDERLDLFKAYSKASKEYTSTYIGRKFPIEAMIRRYYRMLDIANSVVFSPEVEEICNILRTHSGELAESAIISLKLAATNNVFKNPDSLERILRMLDSFIIRAKIAKINEKYIQQQIANAFRRLHLGSLSIGDDDMEGIGATEIFTQLGYSGNDSESEEESKCIENFGYTLFKEDPVIADSLDTFTTSLMEYRMDDDRVCQAILMASDDKHLKTTKRAYTGAHVERFKIPDTPSWRIWFEGSVEGISLQEFNDRYGGTIVCSMLIGPNHNIDFETIGTDGEDNVKVPGTFIADLKRVVQDKDVLYRSLKTWYKFFTKGFNLEAIEKYEKSLISDCEKLWPAPKFSRNTLKSNLGDWVPFNEIQFVTGMKAKGITLNNKEMKPEALKECTKVWKSTLYTIIKLASIDSGGAFTKSPEWKDLMFDPRFRAETFKLKKNEKEPSLINLVNSASAVKSMAVSMAEVAETALLDIYEKEPDISSRVMAYEKVIRSIYLTGRNSKEAQNLAKSYADEVKEAYIKAYMPMGEYYIRLPRSNKQATELVITAMKHIGFNGVNLKI